MAMPKFRIISHVTVPILKLEGNSRKYIKLLEPIHLANESPKQKVEREALIAAGKPIKPIPEIVKVYNYEDQTVYQVVCNEVFKSELRNEYKDNGYVGKSFAVSTNAPAGDKKYKTYQIAEIEVDDENAPAATATPQHMSAGIPEEVQVAADEENAHMGDAEHHQEEGELVAAGESHVGGKRKR